MDVYVRVGFVEAERMSNKTFFVNREVVCNPAARIVPGYRVVEDGVERWMPEAEFEAVHRRLLSEEREVILGKEKP